MLKVLDVDGAVRRVRGGWLATGEPWTYDAARLRRVAAGPRRRAGDHASSTPSTHRLPHGVPAPLPGRPRRPAPAAAATTAPGRCSTPTCRPPSLAAAHAFLGRPGVEIAPKKLWPTGLAAVGVPLKGRIPPAEQIRPGRAVGRLSDLGWGDRLRALVGPDAPDGPLPDDLAGAVVEVLKAWAHGDDRWAQRPAGRGRGRLPQPSEPGRLSLAEQIAAVGRLPLLGTVDLERHRPAPAPRGNSAQRVRALHDAFTVRRRAGRGAGRRWTARCCWSTTWSTPAGRWRWPAARCAGPGRPRWCRWPWR